jgi:hypothetical protein
LNELLDALRPIAIKHGSNNVRLQCTDTIEEVKLNLPRFTRCLPEPDNV